MLGFYLGLFEKRSRILWPSCVRNDAKPGKIYHNLPELLKKKKSLDCCFLLNLIYQIFLLVSNSVRINFFFLKFNTFNYLPVILNDKTEVQ